MVFPVAAIRWRVTSLPSSTPDCVAGIVKWGRTTKVPVQAGFTYWLAENSPMTTEGPQIGAMLVALQADPLNSHRTCAADAPLKGCKSFVEAGSPEDAILPSFALDNLKEVWHG